MVCWKSNPKSTVPAVKRGGGGIMLKVTLGLLVGSRVNAFFWSVTFGRWSPPPLSRVVVVAYYFHFSNDSSTVIPCVI